MLFDGVMRELRRRKQTHAFQCEVSDSKQASVMNFFFKYGSSVPRRYGYANNWINHNASCEERRQLPALCKNILTIKPNRRCKLWQYQPQIRLAMLQELAELVARADEEVRITVHVYDEVDCLEKNSVLRIRMLNLLRLGWLLSLVEDGLEALRQTVFYGGVVCTGHALVNPALRTLTFHLCREEKQSCRQKANDKSTILARRWKELQLEEIFCWKICTEC